jgi:replicative DNA helicase
MELTKETIEKLILQRIFKNLEYRNVVFDSFDERYYENDAIRFIIKNLKTYTEKYNKMPDKNTLSILFEKYKKHKELQKILKESFELKVKNDEKFIEDNIITFLQNKGMYFTVMDNIDNITKKGDINNVIKKFQEIARIEIIQDLGLDYFNDIEKHIEEICNPESLIPTMFTELDKSLNGGILKNGKSLYVIMAQAGLGKSLFLSNLAVNFLMQGLTVAVVTLEMSEMVYAKRIDAHISKLDVNTLAENRDELLEKIIDFKDFYKSRLFIKEFPPNTINANTVEAYLNKIKIKTGKTPDIILIDYLNLMNPNSKTNSGSMYERVGDVARDVRALSYKFEAPVISPTQSNREGWDTSEVGMNNVSESAGIPHTADYLGVLWQQEGDREAGRINLTDLKNRNGAIGQTHTFDINYSNLRITNQDATNLNTEDENISNDIFDEIGF